MGWSGVCTHEDIVESCFFGFLTQLIGASVRNFSALMQGTKDEEEMRKEEE